jgi:hypothetical protein
VNPLSGGRTWWAHFELTRINIEPTILRKKFEDVREAGATLVGVYAALPLIKRALRTDCSFNGSTRCRSSSFE